MKEGFLIKIFAVWVDPYDIQCIIPEPWSGGKNSCIYFKNGDGKAVIIENKTPDEVANELNNEILKLN